MSSNLNKCSTSLLDGERFEFFPLLHSHPSLVATYCISIFYAYSLLIHLGTYALLPSLISYKKNTTLASYEEKNTITNTSPDLPSNTVILVKSTLVKFRTVVSPEVFPYLIYIYSNKKKSRCQSTGSSTTYLVTHHPLISHPHHSHVSCPSSISSSSSSRSSVPSQHSWYLAFPTE